MYECFVLNKNEDLLEVSILQKGEECFLFVPVKLMDFFHIGKKYLVHENQGKFQIFMGKELIQ